VHCISRVVSGGQADTALIQDTNAKLCVVFVGVYKRGITSCSQLQIQKCNLAWLNIYQPLNAQCLLYTLPQAVIVCLVCFLRQTVIFRSTALMEHTVFSVRYELNLYANF
jgi:hypothetical protein